MRHVPQVSFYQSQRTIEHRLPDPIEENGGLSIAIVPRKVFHYHRLPPPLITLRVLKLDGDCFDVQVGRMALVGELKEAVEDVFRQPERDGSFKISWSHVWGHFCLCYQGYKLINDKESLRLFGIKDGDQLYFMRHLSIHYDPAKERSRYHTPSESQKSLGANYNDRLEDGYNDSYEENPPSCSEYGDDEIDDHDLNLPQVVRGWFTVSKLWLAGRLRLESKRHLSWITGNACLKDDSPKVRYVQFQNSV